MLFTLWGNANVLDLVTLNCYLTREWAISVNAVNTGGFHMKRYVCKVCGYAYDPAENDNVPFAELPDDWVCPVCGVGKDQFEEEA